MKRDVVEELFRKYYNGALLYTLSLSKDRALAEDIVSSAFFKALQTADDSVQNFNAWLLRVCRNLYFEHARRQKKHAPLTEDIVSENEHVIESLIREESYQALYHAIELLPEAQREAITLFYFEGLKVKDIAAVTDKTEDYIKVLLYRARENLKNILESKK